MIHIKDIKVLRGLMLIPVEGVLTEIATWIYEYTAELVITSGFRAGDSGVHGQNPLRGLDLRSRVYSYPEHLCDVVNDKWEYDRERPEKKCAILHGKDIHIHLQVHPRTRRRSV